jgi:predicted transcriptional regulator
VPEVIPESSAELAVLVGDIVAAYVSNNPVPPTALPELIASVHGALVNLDGKPPVEVEPVIEPPTAAQIRKSVQQDGIISFIRSPVTAGGTAGCARSSRATAPGADVRRSGPSSGR